MSLSKSKKKGVLLPPAMGYSFKVLVYLIRENQISLRYFPRLFAVIFINLINFPFRAYERLIINPRIEKQIVKNPPIFIIGHWRSGTTHLHNLLSQDPQMGYTSTYQSVFPDTLFNKMGRFLFKGFSSLLIPGRRAGDNVVLGSSLPQEEEFALGDKVPISFYYFWMFPKKILNYYEDAIRFNKIGEQTRDLWKKNYKLLIKKALINTNRPVFLSKNPPNTARIEILLEMFPNAKFVHIHRNPVEVFLSTRNFFGKMLPNLQLQQPGEKELDECIFKLYQYLMEDFFDQKKLIPSANFTEIYFNDLEFDALKSLETIYKELNLKGYQEAKHHFKAYMDKMGAYKKNKHIISKKLLDTILSKWGFAMKKLNYNIPENIQIQDEVS